MLKQPVAVIPRFDDVALKITQKPACEGPKSDEAFFLRVIWNVRMKGHGLVPARWVVLPM